LLKRLIFGRWVTFAKLGAAGGEVCIAVADIRNGDRGVETSDRLDLTEHLGGGHAWNEV
jgi:hypothetical protein